MRPRLQKPGTNSGSFAIFAAIRRAIMAREQLGYRAASGHATGRTARLNQKLSAWH
jgi:hypothetical protein